MYWISEFAVKFLSAFAYCGEGFFASSISAEVESFAVYHESCSPRPTGTFGLVVDAFVSRSVCRWESAIAGILRSCRDSEIRVSIVERLTALFVVCFSWISSVKAENEPVHVNSIASTSLGGVVAFCRLIPLSKPIELVQIFVSVGRYDGVLSFGKGNQFDRLVKRLDDGVTCHVGFHKEPPFLVRLSAAPFHFTPALGVI